MTVGAGAFYARLAWLGPEAGFASGVLVEHSAGLISGVRAGVEAGSIPTGAVRLGGDVCLPGFVNAHSHAFHRALRGVSETRAGDFWTWRDLMYEVAGRLDPDSYRELAEGVYAEMLLAGYTSVGEFHYLHHRPGGGRYDDPNALGMSVVEAAEAAGIRLTLLDACYLQAGVDGTALTGVQLRFGDGSGAAWSERVTLLGETLEDRPRARLGTAIHSVRAVPVHAMRSVVALAHADSLPLHVHLSEQRRENEDCLKVLGSTPTDVLHSESAITASLTAVHATHLTVRDIGRLGLARCSICVCPTTERDLGDGIGPFSELEEAGAGLCIGSDSQAVIDPFEEARAVELNERLVAERRGLRPVASLLEAATSAGSRSLGWPAGGIAAGSVADLVTVSLGSVRLAGGQGADESLLARIMFAAAPSDVDTVVVGGDVVVAAGEHAAFGPREAVAEQLGRAVRKALGEDR